MQSILLTLLLFATIILSGQGEAAEILNTNDKELRQYVTINGESFYFGLNEYTTWFEAEAKCAALGMRLITFNTEARWTMIQEFIFENAVFDFWWWTAGRSVSGSTSWVWTTTNEPYSYTNWFPGEPSNGANDDSCMVFLVGSPFSPGGWDDSLCIGAYSPYVCESIPS